MSTPGFPVRIEPDGAEGLRVTSRDLPELLTWGNSEDEAKEMAADAIDVIVSAAIEEGREVPSPSEAASDEIVIELPAQLAAKVAIWRAFQSSGLSKSELARRMDVGENEVRRILDPKHGTRLEKLDAAAKALGHRLVIGLAA